MIDDVYARVPVDRVAVFVTGPGEQYNPNKRIQTNDSQFPIATRLPTLGEKLSNGFIDLTGSRFGRFTVVGVARDFSKHWVVRCDCGTYSTRRTKSIKNKENTQDRCEHCRHLAFLKRDERRRRTGHDVDINMF